MAHALIRRLFEGRLPALAMFDLDGTLVDSVPDIARALDATLAARGFAPAGRERVRHWVGRGSRNLVREALAHAVDVAPQQVAEDLLDEALAVYLARYLEDCAGATTLMPHAPPHCWAMRIGQARSSRSATSRIHACKTLRNASSSTFSRR